MTQLLFSAVFYFNHENYQGGGYPGNTTQIQRGAEPLVLFFFSHCQLVLRFPSLNVHCSLYHSKYATIFCSMFFFEVALIILLCHVLCFPIAQMSPLREGERRPSGAPHRWTSRRWCSSSAKVCGSAIVLFPFSICTHQNIFPVFFNESL